MPDIHKDLSFATYLAHPGYGSSDLRAFRIGPPAMVPWRRTHREQDTDATRLGSAAHCAILTPEAFHRTYVVKPDGMSFATKEGKAWRDAQRGMTIISHEQGEAVRGVHGAFHAKLPAFESLSRAVGREWSMFWRCRESGLDSKCRPDWFEETVVGDLKVSVVAEREPEGISIAAYRNGWMHQLAHGRAGLAENGYPNVKTGRLVIISPNKPHNVWLLEVSENDMDFLEMDNANTRRAMMECQRTGVWPGTPDDWQKVELPTFASFNEVDLEGALETPV